MRPVFGLSGNHRNLSNYSDCSHKAIGIPPLHLVVEEFAVMSFLRLRGTKRQKTAIGKSHRSMSPRILNLHPIFEIGHDGMTPNIRSKASFHFDLKISF